MARKRSKIAQSRGWMYTISRLLGDVRAVQTGTVDRRVKRRLAGKVSGRLLGKIR